MIVGVRVVSIVQVGIGLAVALAARGRVGGVEVAGGGAGVRTRCGRFWRCCSVTVGSGAGDLRDQVGDRHAVGVTAVRERRRRRLSARPTFAAPTARRLAMAAAIG